MKSLRQRMAAMMALLLLTALPVCAQTELEYRMEVGGMVGTSSCMGDANYHGFYKNVKGGGGAVARYNINPRQALKFDIAYGGISGDASANPYPAATDRTALRFDRSVIDVGCQYELHFWAYGTGNSYKNTHRLVPYIQMGLGFTGAKGAFTLNIPIGIGLKYKVAPRLNAGIDWSVRLSMSDKLDGIADPYRIQSGFLKNKDSYCWTMLFVTYDFMPKLRKCNN